MIKEQIKKFFRCFYRSVEYMLDHNGVEHAGYMSFLILLSFFPFLMFFISIASFIGELEVGRHFIQELFDILPQEFLPAITPRIKEILSGPPQGLLTIAIVGIVWTASSSFEGLRTILNRACRVETPPSYIFRRLFSIIEFLAVILILLSIMFVLIFGPMIWQKVALVMNFDPNILFDNIKYIRFISTILLTFFVISLSYKMLPNVRQRFRKVIPGTILVMVLWYVAVYAFSLYLKTFNQFNVVYGSIAGFILTLLFFYIMSVIYIIGAEFNYMYSYYFTRFKKDISEKREGG